MIEQCKRYIIEQNMIQTGNLVIVGVSGGADSLCLFHLLRNLTGEMDFTLKVVHVEHGIRGEESRQDAAFVKKICDEHQIPCQIFEVDVPAFGKEHHLGLEEAARELRYQAFSKEVEKGIEQGFSKENIKIALAHHGDDNAETILFQLLRGSGIAGLCGMKAVRRAKDGYFFIRPLLWASRKQIETYLQEKKQAFCIDSTNSDIYYSRNRLRQMILPELEQINTEAVCHINQTAKRLENIQDYLAIQAKAAYKECVTQSGESYVIELFLLQQLHPALGEEVIRQTIYQAAGQKKDIGAVHIEAVQALCHMQSGKAVELPYGIVARKEFGNIIFEKKEKEFKAEKEYTFSQETLQELKDTGKEAFFSVGEGEISLKIIKFSGELDKIPKKTYTKFFDYDMIKNGFTIRKRRPGDSICMDSLGHHKKIKDYFIQEKVPKELRENLWLMAQNSHILWVMGMRMGEDCKLSEKTKYALKIQYHGGTEDGLFQES